MDAIGIIRREWDVEIACRRAGRGHLFETGDLAYPVLYRNKRAIVRIRRERGTWEGVPAWRYVGRLEGVRESWPSRPSFGVGVALICLGEISLLIELIPQYGRRSRHASVY
jgi:hypothetical protein